MTRSIQTKTIDEPARLRDRMFIAFLNSCQIGWVKLELLLYPFFVWLFDLRRISLYAIPRSKPQTKDANNLFQNLYDVLKRAKNIRIAVGEIGSELFEQRPVLEGLQLAKDENNATIEMIYGPLADPQTKRIFGFAKRGIVNLFKLQKYMAHHFFLISSSAPVTIIDESTHVQTIWGTDASGSPKPLYQREVLFCFVIPNSRRRLKYMEEEFNRRKSSALFDPERPSFEPGQNYSLLRYVVESSLNMPLKHGLQPLSIFFDVALDLQAENWYRRLKGRIGVMNGKERQHQRSSSPVKEIILDMSTSDIPDATCELCGTQMEKIYMEHNFGGRDIRVRTKHVPGYHCPHDGINFLSEEGALASLTKGRDVLQAEGYSAESRRINDSIEHERKYLTTAPAI